MKTLKIKQNKHFIGREFELSRLIEIQKSKSASIIVAYGRRRVGKTELLEQSFRNRHVIKFEGIEGKNEQAQREWVLKLLFQYTKDNSLEHMKVNTWIDVFELIADFVAQGEWTLYFEEVQWLANYNAEFISELKYVWDNKLRFNDQLILILCGSAPSFIINKVLKSKALYNRSQFEFPVRELNLIETKQFLKKKDNREVLLAYLAVGGIPEYLKRFTNEQSVFVTLCKESFIQGGFFAHEYQRIFTSSLSENKFYKDIIELLSKKHHATREEIVKYTGLKSGGSLTNLLNDLELCGFITKYVPFNLKENSLLSRYMISDNYLQYYFKFIKELSSKIDNGDFNKKPLDALNIESFNKWLGFAFERFCRKYHRIIAEILGFSGVEYQSGAYFSRTADKENPGYQIDLVFERKDHVLSVCEIKYHEAEINTKVIQQMEQKLALFPRKKHKTLQKVLICLEGADKALTNRNYFDRIITLDDLFEAKNW